MRKLLFVVLLTAVIALTAGSRSADAGLHLFAMPQAGGGGHSVALTCTPGAVAAGQDPATSFNFKRSLTTGGPYTIIGNSPACNFTDTGVTASEKLFYVVTGVNAGGESAPSSEVSATIPTFPPPTPGSLAAIPK